MAGADEVTVERLDVGARDLRDRRDLLARAHRVARVGAGPRARELGERGPRHRRRVLQLLLEGGELRLLDQRELPRREARGRAASRRASVERGRELVAQGLDPQREALGAAADRELALELVLEILELLVAPGPGPAGHQLRGELARSSPCPGATARRPSASSAGAGPCRRASSSGAGPPRSRGRAACGWSAPRCCRASPRTPRPAPSAPRRRWP